MTWLRHISPCVRPIDRGATFRSYTDHAAAPLNWLEPLRVIYDHELVLFTGEDFVTEISGHKFRCPNGSYIVVPPGKWHISYNSGRRAGHRYWTHFDWTYQGQYNDTPVITFHPATPRFDRFRHAPRFVPKPILHGTVPNIRHALEIHERLTVMQLYGSAHEKFVSRALLMELLLEIMDKRDRSPEAYGKPIELADRVRNALENAFWGRPNTPPIQPLLSGLGYSYAHLCRSFRAKFGITPLKFIHTLQVTRAKMLLVDTDLSVSEIGYRNGFNNPAYFTLLFRKMTGLTPSGFRETAGGLS